MYFHAMHSRYSVWAAPAVAVRYEGEVPLVEPAGLSGAGRGIAEQREATSDPEIEGEGAGGEVGVVKAQEMGTSSRRPCSLDQDDPAAARRGTGTHVEERREIGPQYGRF